MSSHEPGKQGVLGVRLFLTCDGICAHFRWDGCKPASYDLVTCDQYYSLIRCFGCVLTDTFFGVVMQLSAAEFVGPTILLIALCKGCHSSNALRFSSVVIGKPSSLTLSFLSAYVSDR